MNADLIYKNLEDYLVVVKNAYLHKHLANPLATPEDYDLDIKSFCILSHAAFEEFVETTVLAVMDDAISKYQSKKKITAPLISLMHFKGGHNNYLETKNEKKIMEEIDSFFDYNRKKLDEIKKIFSNEVYDNHGIALKYLKKLLIPVAIDISKEVNWNNSLKMLADERGAYAHKFMDKDNKGRVKQSINPELAKTIVDDCSEMCKDIMNKAKEVTKVLEPLDDK